MSNPRMAVITHRDLDERISDLNGYINFPEGYELIRAGGEGFTSIEVIDPKGDKAGTGERSTKRDCLIFLHNALDLREMCKQAWRHAARKLEASGLIGDEHAIMGKEEGRPGKWKVWIEDGAYQALYCANTGATKHIFLPLDSSSIHTLIDNLVAID